MPYGFTTTVTVSDEMVEQIIDSAGYGIGYWAYTAHVDEDDQTYTVHEFVDGENIAHVVTYYDLAAALIELTRSTEVRHDLVEYARNAVLSDDPGDIDAEVADVIVQFAIFGEIIYG